LKRATRIILSVLLTAGFLFLFLRGFDLAAAWRSVRGASPALIALSIALNLAAYVVRAWRWRYLLAPVRERLGMYNLLSATMIGFMISFLVPFRAGEVVRPVLLARRERLSAGAALATIALERMLDMLTVMSLFLVFRYTAHGASVLAGAAGAGSQASMLLREGLRYTAVVVAVSLPIVVALVVFPRAVLAALGRLSRGRPGRLAAALATLERFLSGLGAMRRVRELAGSLTLSVLMWLMIGHSIFLALRAFDLDLAFIDTLLLMVPLTVGIAMPTPGGVGPYEYLCQIALADFWGVPGATAAAVAVTLHACTLVPPILIGLTFMWRDGVRPREVRALRSTGDLPPGRVEAS
jgi:uncharacterized protein (TIRG00374 family)